MYNTHPLLLNTAGVFCTAACNNQREEKNLTDSLADLLLYKNIKAYVSFGILEHTSVLMICSFLWKNSTFMFNMIFKKYCF